MTTENMDQFEIDLPEGVEPEGETKAEAFTRLAVPRYKTAVKRIRLLGNLGNRNNYEYMDEQVATMFARLRAEIDDAEKKFAAAGSDDIEGPF